MSSGQGTPAAAIASVPMLVTPAGGYFQQVSASRPPLRSTRRNSASAAAGSPTALMTKLPVTASNAPSGSGRSGSTASRTSKPGTLRAAASAMLGSASTAVTRAPRAAAAPATTPGPVPTSSTLVPAATPAASSSAPAACAVSRANPRS